MKKIKVSELERREAAGYIIPCVGGEEARGAESALRELKPELRSLKALLRVARAARDIDFGGLDQLLGEVREQYPGYALDQAINLDDLRSALSAFDFTD